MEDYGKIKEGLNSDDPALLLQSAIWLIENSTFVQEQEEYRKACEILYTAALEDVECLQYIDKNIQNNPMFKAQLFSQVLRETKDKEIKDAVRLAMENMLRMLTEWKNFSTEIVAQIYSCLEDCGDAEILEKAKKFLSI